MFLIQRWWEKACGITVLQLRIEESGAFTLQLKTLFLCFRYAFTQVHAWRTLLQSRQERETPDPDESNPPTPGGACAEELCRIQVCSSVFKVSGRHSWTSSSLSSFHFRDSEHQGICRKSPTCVGGRLLTKTPMTRVFWQLCCWLTTSLGANPCDFLVSIPIITAVAPLFFFFFDCFENLGYEDLDYEMLCKALINVRLQSSVRPLPCRVPDITRQTHVFSGVLGGISTEWLPQVAPEKMRENRWEGKSKNQEMTRTCNLNKYEWLFQNRSATWL